MHIKNVVHYNITKKTIATIGKTLFLNKKMIQRVQTLYLLLYIAITLGLWFVLFHSTDVNNLLGDLRHILLVLTSLSVISLFLYRKRRIQMRMLIFTLVCHMAWCAFVIYTFDTIAILDNGFLWAFFFCGPLFLGLAYRGVKKDENLIRSVDRLR